MHYKDYYRVLPNLVGKAFIAIKDVIYNIRYYYNYKKRFFDLDKRVSRGLDKKIKV